MQNQRLIGLVLVLIGMGWIFVLYSVIFPNLMTTAKTFLLMLFEYESTYPINPEPYRSELITILIFTTFQSFQQIESSSINIYIGMALGIFGAILMFFEGVSFDFFEDEEEEDKQSPKSNKKV
ncbi:MAG: hypothetical protein HWN67_02285 [Candidatus Helarchaeota archaeon]|nr:hypothetical protein [Candidatus Helarchaeota archaeon]